MCQVSGVWCLVSGVMENSDLRWISRLINTFEKIGEGMLQEKDVIKVRSKPLCI